jgi:hypothetical protein
MPLLIESSCGEFATACGAILRGLLFLGEKVKQDA